MPTFVVRLESTTDAQWREVTCEAASADEAESLALLREAEYVDYSLDTDLYLDDAGREQVAACVVDDDGHVTGAPARARARFHMHHQAEPYRVASVEEQLPSGDAAVRAILALQQNDKAWERVVKALADAGHPLAAVTGSLFGVTAKGMIDGSASIVWSSATIKVALTTSAYTPDQDLHDFFNDVTNEITGTGYTAGGATLASKTSTYDTATDQIRLDAADTQWTTSTLTARRAVVWNDTAGASSTDPVMGWVDFGADVSTTAGTFTITWDSTGIIVYDVT